MDFFFLEPLLFCFCFLHGFVARMNRRTLVRVFFYYFNSKFHLETVPSESHACYI